MTESVRLRKNGSSTVASIPKRFLAAADMLCGMAAVWELLPDKSLRLSILRDARVQPFQPLQVIAPSQPSGAK